MGYLKVFKKFLSKVKKKKVLPDELKGMGLSFKKSSNFSGFPISPVSKRGDDFYFSQIDFPAQRFDHSFKIKLYRFLRDNIPVLNSAVWVWTRFCSTPGYFELKGSDDKKLLDSAKKIIDDLDQKIFHHSYQKFGGVEAMLFQFFSSLFTDGAVCGEVTVSPNKEGLDKFFFISD